MWETMLKIADRDYFRIPILQGILKTRSRHEEDLCVSSGSQTATCEIISLDAGLRMDGISALDFWDLVIEASHSSSHLKHWEQKV